MTIYLKKSEQLAEEAKGLIEFYEELIAAESFDEEQATMLEKTMNLCKLAMEVQIEQAKAFNTINEKLDTLLSR